MVSPTAAQAAGPEKLLGPRAIEGAAAARKANLSTRGPLFDEWRAYYAAFPDDKKDSSLERAHKQRVRKGDWKRKRESAYAAARAQ